MKTGLQLRMEEFSALRRKEHGGSGVSFVVEEAGAWRVAAAFKCSFCGAVCELGYSSPSQLRYQASRWPSSARLVVRFSQMMRNMFVGLTGVRRKLDVSKVLLANDYLVSGRGFSGLEELIFNMELPNMFSKTYETYTGFLYGQMDALWSTIGREFVSAADNGVYEVAVSNR